MKETGRKRRTSKAKIHNRRRKEKGGKMV